MERRDAIWRLINQEQDADIAEDTLVSFDSFLLFLMGSLDAAARLTHGVLDIKGPLRLAGWQKLKWLRMIDVGAPKVAGIFVAGSREASALKALSLLRNTIHDEGLASVTVGHARRVEATWIGLPRTTGAKIVDATDRMASRKYWGIQESAGRFYAEPGPLADGLLSETLQTLGHVLLELERALSETTPAPGPCMKSRLNEELLGQNVLWQLGLSEATGE